MLRGVAGAESMVRVSAAGFRPRESVVAAALIGLLMAGPAKAEDRSPGEATVVDGQWAATVSTELQYYSWTSTRGYPATTTGAEGKGSQVFMPVGIQLTGRPSDLLSLEFLVRSAFFWSEQTTAGTSGEAHGTTDTSLTATGTYYGLAGFQPFIALATNLPTGKTVLSGGSGASKFDADIVDTPVYGEGWNGGLTIGGNIPLTETLVASLGAGYTYRGAYDREAFNGPGATTRLDPGDTYSVNAGLGYQGDRLSLQTQVSYTGETETELNGQPFYRSGGSIFTSLAGGYAWNDAWASNASISYSHASRNRVLAGPLPPLVKEAFDSNSDVVEISLGTGYAAETYTIGPTLGFVYRDRNAWSPTALEYLPAKTSWALGLGGQYAATPALLLSGGVTHMWLNENETPRQDRARTGFGNSRDRPPAPGK